MTDRVRMSGPRRFNKKKKVWRPKKDHGKIQKLQKEVSAIKKSLKTEIEVKNYDVNFPISNVDWNGSMSVSLFTPSQGVGRSARVGSKVKLTGIDFRYRVIAPANALDTIRVILFQDKPNSTTAPSDVLVSTTLGTTMAPLAFFDRDKRQDYNILYDKQHEFDYATGNLQGIVNVKINKQIPVQFDDGTALVMENAIRVLIVSNTATVGAMPQFEANWRFYYVDL